MRPMPNRFFRRANLTFAEELRHAISVACVVLPSALLLVTAFYAAPVIETRFFPVVTNFHITKIVAYEGGSMISAEADKVRDCPRWRQTLWYYGTRGADNVPLPTMQHLDKPKVNGIGKLEWQRIFVPVPPEDIPHTFSDAYHACWPWEWWTRSELFNPPAGG
jgi:hypothetical protein